MLVKSRQCGVRFVWCDSPVSIDKRAAWGENHDNLQIARDGAFLKMNDDFNVSHLVQPNADKSAPVGWVKTDVVGLFDKSPVYVVELVHAGKTVHVETLDGPMDYEVKEYSAVVCNYKDGEPDLNDCWVQTVANLEKNYFIDSLVLA